MVEVIRQAEAQQLPQAHRHPGIAPEVEVELQRVADDAQPGQGHGDGPDAPDPDLAQDARQVIRHHDLAGHAQDEVFQTLGKPSQAPPGIVQLVQQLLRLRPGTGDQLGEHQYPGGVLPGAHKASLPGEDQQGDHLKGIEAETQGQTRRPGQEEPGQLHIGQRRGSKGQPQGEDPLFPQRFPPKQQAAQKAEQGHPQQQKQLPEPSPHPDGVENQAPRAEQGEAPPEGQLPVEKEKDREKKKQKAVTVEGHGCVPLLIKRS